jgi:hypothetical protein
LKACNGRAKLAGVFPFKFELGQKKIQPSSFPFPEGVGGMMNCLDKNRSA